MEFTQVLYSFEVFYLTSTLLFSQANTDNLSQYLLCSLHVTSESKLNILKVIYFIGKGKKKI